jgi:hypothetical protein
MAVRVIMLLLVVDVALARLPHPECKIVGNDDFDFKPLQKGEEEKPYYAVSPKGHYHYYFNFCGHAAGCYQQPSCQVKMSTDSQGNAKEDVATVTTTGELYRMIWEKLDTDDLKFVNEEMVRAKLQEDEDHYTSGVKVTYSIGPKHRKTVIRMPCDPEAADDRMSPVEVVEKPILTYNIIYPSQHACELSFSKKTIKLPSMSNIHRSKSSFFGIMLFAGIVLYCCVGCYYKREKLGAQGFEAIPHIDSMTACAEGVSGCFSGESAVGSMLNRARGVSDDGL